MKLKWTAMLTTSSYTFAAPHLPYSNVPGGKRVVPRGKLKWFETILARPCPAVHHIIFCSRTWMSIRTGAVEARAIKCQWHAHSAALTLTDRGRPGPLKARPASIMPVSSAHNWLNVTNITNITNITEYYQYYQYYSVLPILHNIT